MPPLDDAPEFIDALKQRYGVRTDEELAKALKVSRKTISSWRSRGRVPYSIQVAYQIGGHAPHDVYWAPDEAASSQIELICRSIAIHVRDRYRDLPNLDTRAEALAFWAGEFPRIEAKVALHIRRLNLNGLTVASAVDELVYLIDRGEILSFAEALDLAGTSKK